MSYIYIGLFLVWVTALLLGLALYRERSKRATQEHEQRTKELEAQQALFENDDERL